MGYYRRLIRFSVVLQLHVAPPLIEVCSSLVKIMREVCSGIENGTTWATDSSPALHLNNPTESSSASINRS